MKIKQHRHPANAEKQSFSSSFLCAADSHPNKKFNALNRSSVSDGKDSEETGRVRERRCRLHGDILRRTRREAVNGAVEEQEERLLGGGRRERTRRSLSLRRRLHGQ